MEARIELEAGGSRRDGEQKDRAACAGSCCVDARWGG